MRPLPRMTEIRAGLAETWFAWSGPATATPGANIVSYYRIQVPTWSSNMRRREAIRPMHIHAMYRDPTNDYGLQVYRQVRLGPPR